MDVEAINFLAIDFETADTQGDSACAIGLVKVMRGQVVAREHFLIRPPRSRVMFTEIHGIRWEDVANEPGFGQVWPRFAHYFEGVTYLAAHNASFDRRVLNACCEANGIPMPPQPFLCTVKMARHVWSLFPTKLPDVCRHLGLSLQHHQALSDAEACASIVLSAFSAPDRSALAVLEASRLGEPRVRRARQELNSGFYVRSR